jgi:phage tail protein X
MAQTYKTRQGDVLDEIAWRQYGACGADVLRLLLEANHGLADHGAVLPAGVAITLPDIAKPASTQKAVSLWD